MIASPPRPRLIQGPGSCDTCRLGQITKQGSPLLRFVLGQAGLIAAHAEVDLKRHYPHPASAPRPPQSHRRHCSDTARAALHHAPGSD